MSQWFEWDFFFYSREPHQTMFLRPQRSQLFTPGSDTSSPCACNTKRKPSQLLDAKSRRFPDSSNALRQHSEPWAVSLTCKERASTNLKNSWSALVTHSSSPGCSAVCQRGKVVKQVMAQLPRFSVTPRVRWPPRNGNALLPSQTISASV